MKTKRPKRKLKTQPGGSLEPVGSAAMRGELLILECGIEECARGLNALTRSLEILQGISRPYRRE